MASPAYRFHFHITDETTGDVIAEDFASFENVDQFGGCEAIDHQVARMMRMFNRALRATHEAENYSQSDKQLVTQTTERIRAVVGG